MKFSGSLLVHLCHVSKGLLHLFSWVESRSTGERVGSREALAYVRGCLGGIRNVVRHSELPQRSCFAFQKAIGASSAGLPAKDTVGFEHSNIPQTIANHQEKLLGGWE